MKMKKTTKKTKQAAPPTNHSNDQTPITDAPKKNKALAKFFRGAWRANVPLLGVSTPDIPATQEQLMNALNGQRDETAVFVWDAVRGLRPTDALSLKMAVGITGSPDPTAAADTLGELTRALHEAPTATMGLLPTLPQHARVVFAEHNPTQAKADPEASFRVLVLAANLHRYCQGNGSVLDPSSAAIVQAIANLRDVFKTSDSTLVLLGAVVTLPVELQADFLTFDQPLPSDEELGGIYDKLADGTLSATQNTPETRVQAVNATRGVTPFAAEQIVAMNISGNAGVDLPGLWAAKRSMINAVKGLSYYTGTAHFDRLGGCEAVKEFYGDVLRGEDAPLGIVRIEEIEKAFGGTDGDNTGVAQDFLGVTLTFMEENKIPGGMLVGHPGTGKSEFARALGCVTNIPVLDLDLNGMKESLLGKSGDNLRNAYKTILALFGGRVLFLATSNGLESLKPELLRRFRFPTFFFDLPSAEEQAIIWDVWLANYSLTERPTFDFSGWTGAEIQACCENAWRLRKTVNQTARWIVPSYIAHAQSIAARGQGASGRYLDAGDGSIFSWSGLPAKTHSLPASQVPARRRRVRDE